MLYCAGSLGRLGGDFSLLLAELEEDSSDEEEGLSGDGGGEWVEVMRKHRVLAGKLESLASGAGGRGMAKGVIDARVKSPVSEGK